MLTIDQSQAQSEPNGKGTVEILDVGKVRSFFDEKTKNHKADKLSQAYISISRAWIKPW
jgi:hypothetical protein